VLATLAKHTQGKNHRYGTVHIGIDFMSCYGGHLMVLAMAFFALRTVHKRLILRCDFKQSATRRIISAFFCHWTPTGMCSLQHNPSFSYAWP